VSAWTWLLGSPKALLAGVEAMGLFMWGIAYAKTHRTDGMVIERAAVTALGGKRNKALAERLVSAGLWQGVEGGYMISDWETYAPKRRARRSEAGPPSSYPPSSSSLTEAEKRRREVARVQAWRERKAAERQSDRSVTCYGNKDVTAVAEPVTEAVTSHVTPCFSDVTCGVTPRNTLSEAPIYIYSDPINRDLDPDPDLPGSLDQSGRASAPSDRPTPPSDRPKRSPSSRPPPPSSRPSQKPKSRQDAPGRARDTSPPPTPQPAAKSSSEGNLVSANGPRAVTTPPDWWPDAIATAEMAVGDIGEPLAWWLEYSGSRTRKVWAPTHSDAAGWLCTVVRNRRDQAARFARSEPPTGNTKIRQPVSYDYMFGRDEDAAEKNRREKWISWLGDVHFPHRDEQDAITMMDAEMTPEDLETLREARKSLSGEERIKFDIETIEKYGKVKITREEYNGRHWAKRETLPRWQWWQY